LGFAGCKDGVALRVDSVLDTESTWLKAAQVQHKMKHIRITLFKLFICGKNMEAGALIVFLLADHLMEQI